MYRFTEATYLGWFIDPLEPEPEPLEKKWGAGAGAAWKKRGAGAGAGKILSGSPANLLKIVLVCLSKPRI